MTTPLESLVASGTKLWLDSVDPELVKQNIAHGATGATSNPIIISDLIGTGRFDDQLGELLGSHDDDADVAWAITDKVVKDAQGQFHGVWQKTNGNDGWVSFELDPLLEDADCPLSVEEKAAKYIELGKQWSAGHDNRMIKIPATPGGLAAIEELCAAGVTLNVTLCFTMRQYEEARDAMWRGAQRRGSLENFKSVYSIFVSRIDVYTEKHAAELSDDAQGMVGIVNAQRIWQANQEFWADKGTPLQQEIIFASTGTKKPEDPKWKYVAALAGSDIQTNPPATNDAVQESGQTFEKKVDQLPPADVLADIDAKVDFAHLEKTLMEEGLKKFADPQKKLIAKIGEKRAELAGV
ncbi:Transaldolase [Pseudobythopirellula maris]|uniref:Transaldolase n=1 Tax=Pseudobythopirellula maris TaxID=2527991 RepID=A0A5C5ZMC2_9BACT|nr:transaldolase family protein [Pseudobythopirellula maris]TWT88246.1 Transaldolase [Pseudobythopirellula maris]